MCVDTTHKVVRQETAYQILKAVIDDQHRNPNYREDAAREIIGSVVMTR